MAKYILTKNFTEIAETSGVLQNLSGDSNIEITSNINEQGILLKPFQMISFSQKVYARKVNGAGTAQLVCLPSEAGIVSAENYLEENVSNSVASAYDNPYADFENNFKPRGSPHRPPPMPFWEPNKPLAVNETPTHYLVAISKDSLHGQKKFLIQFSDDMKG